MLLHDDIVADVPGRFGFEVASYGRVEAKATGAIAPIAARCSRRRNANQRKSRPLR